MENRVPFQINSLVGFVPVFAALGRIGHVRLLRCGDGLGGLDMRGEVNRCPRAGVANRDGDLVDNPSSLLGALCGHSDLAGGDDHEAHSLALGGLEVGVEGFDGGQAEIIVRALQRHPEEVSYALGVRPDCPLGGEG